MSLVRNDSVPAAVVNEDAFNTRVVVKNLEGLMTKVTEGECTPETVNAACNCADKITNILKVHLEIARLKAKHS